MGQVKAQVILGERGFALTECFGSCMPRPTLWEAGSSHRHARQRKEPVPSPSPERLIIKTHTSHTEANTWHGGIGILQHGLDPSPSKSGTSARESNTYLWIRWTPSRIRCITYWIKCNSDWIRNCSSPSKSSKYYPHYKFGMAVSPIRFNRRHVKAAITFKQLPAETNSIHHSGWPINISSREIATQMHGLSISFSPRPLSFPTGVLSPPVTCWGEAGGSVGGSWLPPRGGWPET